MDITNIYGLHLGCRVYVKEFSHRGKFNKFPETGIIKAVKKGSVRVGTGSKPWAKISNTKLCLMKVEDITAKDKKAFTKEFFPKGNTLVKAENGSVDGKVIIYWTRSGKLTGEPYKDSDFCSMAETLWLASHGYDVGIVPREYVKIVKPAKDTK